VAALSEIVKAEKKIIRSSQSYTIYVVPVRVGSNGNISPGMHYRNTASSLNGPYLYCVNVRVQVKKSLYGPRQGLRAPEGSGFQIS